MRLSSHPNVLRCLAAFTVDTNLWLVTQLMEKGSSLHCINSARATICARRGGGCRTAEIAFEDHITYILHETLLGLQYIHSNGQIHRDIKASNILLSSTGRVLIADFGVSGWLVHGGSRRKNTRTFVGTPCWMAPEVMEQVQGYDYRADIWSLGITALELAKGYAPYARYAPMKVLLLTIQQDPPTLDTYNDGDADEGVCTSNGDYTTSFKNMVKLCLQKDPKRRPDCDGLLGARHFAYLEDKVRRAEACDKIRSDLCDIVKDVGIQDSTAGTGDGRSGEKNVPGTDPVCIVESTDTSRPAGTTWVFSDGSQVLASSQTGSQDGVKGSEVGGGDFFDDFERQTTGENFSREKAEAVDSTKKDDINDFLDEFERNTTGENFQRKP